MLNVMSKFLALGVPLPEVIRESTTNPATEIRRPQLGQIAVGAEADIAVLRLERGKFGYVDVKGGRIEGDQRLGCEMTLPRRKNCLRPERPRRSPLARVKNRIPHPLMWRGLAARGCLPLPHGTKNLPHPPRDQFLITRFIHEKRKHNRPLMPQDSDPRLSFQQLLLALVVTDPQRLLVPLGPHAMDPPRSVMRSEADLHPRYLLQLTRKIFRLLRILTVDRREIQPRIFFGG